MFLCCEGNADELGFLKAVSVKKKMGPFLFHLHRTFPRSACQSGPAPPELVPIERSLERPLARRVQGQRLLMAVADHIWIHMTNHIK